MGRVSHCAPGDRLFIVSSCHVSVTFRASVARLPISEMIIAQPRHIDASAHLHHREFQHDRKAARCMYAHLHKFVNFYSHPTWNSCSELTARVWCGYEPGRFISFRRGKVKLFFLPASKKSALTRHTPFRAVYLFQPLYLSYRTLGSPGFLPRVPLVRSWPRTIGATPCQYGGPIRSE